MSDAPSLLAQDNSTAPHTATWHPDPTFRGTWGLISTCLATLLICVWKAVHMDIPLRQSPWNFVDKLGWLFVGIFAPDLLLYVACCQLRHANSVRELAEQYLRCPSVSRSYLDGLLSRVRGCSKVRSTLLSIAYILIWASNYSKRDSLGYFSIFNAVSCLRSTILSPEMSPPRTW